MSPDVLDDHPWAQSVMARFKGFKDLEDGWLNGDGLAPSALTIERAIFFTAAISHLDLTRPASGPGESGELVMEWSIGPWELSVDFLDDLMSLRAINVDTDEDSKADIGFSDDGINDAVDWLAYSTERANRPSTKTNDHD